MDSILRGIGESESGNPLAARIALILGAGGVARSIAYGLKKREADVVITNRTDERAKQLAQQLSCRWIDWNARHSIKPHLIVNCTPVGMHPNVDESPYHRHYLRRQVVVFDTIYNPEQTLFVKEARQQGCRTVTGVDMFVRQAAMQFKLFTRLRPPIPIMLEQIRRAIGAARYESAAPDEQLGTAEEDVEQMTDEQDDMIDTNDDHDDDESKPS
jgi:3-dehydroquinate dehydratase/shikimate dehydrogenase